MLFRSIIEINKVNRQEEDIYEWIELFKCKREEELEMLKGKTNNPGILVAIDALREMSLSKALKAEWDFYLKQRRDRNARDEFVRDEVISIGKAEGKAVGKAVSVEQIMKKMNLDLKTACDIIGISVEEYDAVRKQDRG